MHIVSAPAPIVKQRTRPIEKSEAREHLYRCRKVVARQCSAMTFYRASSALSLLLVGLLIGYGNEGVVDEAIASLLNESVERLLEANTSRIVK
ncbi:hypothetical protein Y600_6067 [Burkholderia pseudomallei MSHR3709]|nr:hypothetical protein Y600_6067 [Burkholderia pseudomallei MSHR3709]